MEAVSSGNVDHVDLLLKAGAKPGRIIFKHEKLLLCHRRDIDSWIRGETN